VVLTLRALAVSPGDLAVLPPVRGDFLCPLVAAATALVAVFVPRFAMAVPTRVGGLAGVTGVEGTFKLLPGDLQVELRSLFSPF